MVASGLGTIEFSTTGCIKKHLLLLFIAFFFAVKGFSLFQTSDICSRRLLSLF